MDKASVVVRWIKPVGPGVEPPSIHLSILDDAELTTSGQFKQDRHRKEYIAAHALLRLTLEDMTGVAAEKWRFHYAPSGQPSIIAPCLNAPLHFSLSHTEDLAVVAISRLGPIGVDAELRVRAIDLDTCNIVMTDHEMRQIIAKGSEEAVRFWTLKEAYSKAIGKGLQLDFKTIDFSLSPPLVPSPNASPTLNTTNPGGKWRFQSFLTDETHMVSLALLLPTSKPYPEDVRIDYTAHTNPPSTVV